MSTVDLVSPGANPLLHRPGSSGDLEKPSWGSRWVSVRRATAEAHQIVHALVQVVQSARQARNITLDAVRRRWEPSGDEACPTGRERSCSLRPAAPSQTRKSPGELARCSLTGPWESTREVPHCLGHDDPERAS
eukprot:9339314-Pyramimonas_sp.AAC.1